MSAPPAATATPQPRIVPTISQPVRIPWLDWLEQILVHEEPLIATLVEAGVDIGLGSIPIVGPAAIKLVGPTIVKQIVDQGIKLLIVMIAKQPSFTVNPPSWLHDFTVETVRDLAPNFAKAVGAQLDEMIAKAIVKAAPPVPPVDRTIGGGGTKPTGII